MFIMSTTLSQPDIIVLTAVVLVAVFFFVRAVLSRILSQITPQDQPQTEFLLAGRTITPSSIRISTAATYSAFATVFFWFVVIGGIYSYWLFLIPLALYFGNVFFISFVKRSGTKIEDHQTIGSYLRAASKDRWLQRSADLIIFIAVFSALVVEINIGSEIFSGILPGVPGGQLFFVALFSLLIIGYILIGGYRAVIVSDGPQLVFTVLGALAFILFVVVYLTPTTTPVQYLYAPSVSAVNLAAFLISVFVVQFLGPLCQLQNWHRISSAQNAGEALNAHRQGALLGAGLWTLMVIGTLVLNAKSGGSVQFPVLFEKMEQAGVVSAFGLYPLVFVGFVTAMLSTADSAIFAVYYFLYDAIQRHCARTGTYFVPTYKTNLLVGSCIFAVILTIYVLFQTRIHDLTISIIYFLFNQLLVLYPALYFFLRVSRYKLQGGKADTLQRITKDAEPKLRWGIIAGWFVVAGMFGISMLMKKPLSVGVIEITSLDVLMLSSGAGVAVAGLFSLRPLRALRSVCADVR